MPTADSSTTPVDATAVHVPMAAAAGRAQASRRAARVKRMIWRFMVLVSCSADTQGQSLGRDGGGVAGDGDLDVVEIGGEVDPRGELAGVAGRRRAVEA